MKWWKRLFGQAGTEPAPSTGSFPVNVALIPGELTASVHAHAASTGAEQNPFWTYVTQGLQQVGQKELIFSLLREPDEEPAAFPHDPLRFFVKVHALARQGRLVDAGQSTLFRDSAGFLG